LRHAEEDRRPEPATSTSWQDLMKHVHADWVAELAERHGRMVFGTAYRVLGNPDDAEDALQDVFLRLLRTHGSERRPECVRDWGAYLRVAATRAAVDLLRRKSKWNRNHQPVHAEIEDGKLQPVDALITRQSMAERLRRGLARLPKRDAQVFVLRHVEGLRYEQIASEMGLTVSHVGVILHRAQRRLRDVLGPALEGSLAHDGRGAEKMPNSSQGR
jgi:RNA polymerase sigma-70 factor (ECF subfamily)